MQNTPILIVGGGPVGLNLALDLAWRGVPSTLVNKSLKTPNHPQGNTHNARTMEHYRRLGIANRIRKVGLPLDHCGDAVFVTRINKHELARINIPSLRQRLAPGSSDLEIGPEPLQRASQMFVESILKQELEKKPNVDLRFGWKLNSFEQKKSFVISEICDITCNKTERIKSKFLIGCDGGRSSVRRSLGIEYSGKTGEEVDFMMGRMLSIYFEAPHLYRVIKTAPPWQFHAMNAEGRASIVSLDGKGKFLTWAKLKPKQDAASVDPRLFIWRVIGKKIPIKILSSKPWQAGLSLVADQYQQGQILLAGDAAHLFTPTGGFGMNTGIGDAENLGWKLAATYQGWAGKQLIETYEIERRPVAIRNLSQSYSLAKSKSALAVPINIEEESPTGEQERLKLGTQIVEALKEEYFCMGIQLGARYDGSPIVGKESEKIPISDPFTYIPTSYPGGRAPHLWLPDGTALFDHFGKGFTLLQLGTTSKGVKQFENTAARMGVPVSVFKKCSAAILDLYQCNFCLIRPDQYVAWRGNELPQKPEKLLKMVTGQH